MLLSHLINEEASTQEFFCHVINNILLFLTSGIFLSLFSNVPSGTPLKTSIDSKCSPLDKMQKKQEIRCLDFSKVLILIVFYPIFSKVVFEIGSKDIGVYSTFPMIIDLFSKLNSIFSFIV